MLTFIGGFFAGVLVCAIFLIFVKKDYDDKVRKSFAKELGFFESRLSGYLKKLENKIKIQ